MNLAVLRGNLKVCSGAFEPGRADASARPTGGRALCWWIESLGVPRAEIGAARIRPASTALYRDVDAQLGTRIDEDCSPEVDPAPRVAGASLDPSTRFPK